MKMNTTETHTLASSLYDEQANAADGWGVGSKKPGIISLRHN